MKTKSLAFVAGIVWLIAGFNVCRIGIATWHSVASTSLVMIAGCGGTLALFANMFVKMLFKNVRRIRRIETKKRRMWNIMPLKSYIIMAVMITFGVVLRRCALIPPAFIAAFYVGLGAALMLAGVIYISVLICPEEL